jgi:hypothetical protein
VDVTPVHGSGPRGCPDSSASLGMTVGERRASVKNRGSPGIVVENLWSWMYGRSGTRCRLMRRDDAPDARSVCCRVARAGNSSRRVRSGSGHDRRAARGRYPGRRAALAVARWAPARGLEQGRRGAGALHPRCGDPGRGALCDDSPQRARARVGRLVARREATGRHRRVPSLWTRRRHLGRRRRGRDRDGSDRRRDGEDARRPSRYPDRPRPRLVTGRDGDRLFANRRDRSRRGRG